MIPLDLHYQFPAGAYFILLCFVSFLLFWRLFAYRLKLPFSKKMVASHSPLFFWIKGLLSCAALLFSAIALMQPVGNGYYPKEALSAEQLTAPKAGLPLQLKRKAHEIVLLVDASASMGVKDARLQKNRLEYAKDIAEEIVAGLSGEAIALNTFTTKTLQLSPPTNDYIFVRLALREVQINEGGFPGTDIGNALLNMRDRYFPMAPSKSTPKLKTLILLSDGGDTAMAALPMGQRAEKIAAISSLLRGAAEQNLRIYTIGMGSSSGGIIPLVSDGGKPVESKLESQLLQELAKVGRGKYFEANRYPPAQLAKELLADISRDPPYYEVKEQLLESSLLQNLFGGLIYERYFQVPLGLALICLALALFLPSRLERLLLLLFFCGLQIPLQAQTKPSMDEANAYPQLHQAKALAESKMFDEARNIYEGLLAMPLTANERAALHFNIATTYLQQQTWEQATAELSNIPNEKDLPLFLRRRIIKNLVIALYKNALSVQQEDPSQALKLLSRASEISDRLPEEQRKGLQRAIKQELAQSQLLENKIKLALATPLQAAQILAAATREAMEGLSFLNNQPMPKKLFEEYCALFSQEQKLWLPVWKVQRNKMHSAENFAQFDRAEGYYLQMAAFTQKGEVKSAEKASESAMKAISELIEQLAKGALLKEELRQLLNEYQRLLTRRSWQKTIWSPLQGSYTAIAKIDDKDAALIKQEIGNSHQRLEAAIEASQANKRWLAHLLMEDGAQWVRLALTKVHPLTSKELLEALIQQQRYLLERANMLLEKPEDAHKGTLMALLQAGQAGLSSVAELYYPTLYQEQIQAFRQERICQAMPWKEVLPLFQNGKQAAAAAHANLQIDSPDLLEVVDLQKKALKFWQKALVAIDRPASQQAACDGAGAAAAAQSPAASGSRNETLSTLLQMELEDRIKPQTPSLEANVANPW